MGSENTMKDILYKEIFESILRGEYRPNQIINERELTERFGCSKSPIREALIILCNDYVLRNIPRYGYEVIPLNRQDVDEMLQTRYLLEGGMLRLTYDKFSSVQLEKLKFLDNACIIHTSDVWDHWENNSAFHSYLMTPAQNHFAHDLLVRTMRRLKRAYSQFFIDQQDELFMLADDTKKHEQIIDALARKDLPSALRALKEDLQCFGNLRCEIPDFFPDICTES